MTIDGSKSNDWLEATGSIFEDPSIDIRAKFPWISSDTISPWGFVIPNAHGIQYEVTPLILASMVGNLTAVEHILSQLKQDGTIEYDINACDSLGRYVSRFLFSTWVVDPSLHRDLTNPR
jgi:hypothetical protein